MVRRGIRIAETRVRFSLGPHFTIMENLESQKEKSRLDELKDLIADAPARIESEFSRTANDWLSCFGSSIFQIEAYLVSPKVRMLLDPDECDLAEKRLEELKEQLHELKEKYPDKETVPPEEIKQELLGKLDIFRK